MSLFNTGYTLYQSTGIHIDYTKVDFEKQQVIGKLSFNGKIHMTVIVNLQSNTLEVEGTVIDLNHLMPNGNLENDYVKMIKDMAMFFIENKIGNPKEYYENLLTGQRK